jgi:hypothetical protein
MRRFLLIAGLLWVAALATMVVIMLFSEGSTTLIADVGRLVLLVLLTPLGWLLAPLTASMPIEAQGTGQVLLLIPNALLWSAVICWWLDRRARKHHSEEADSLQE